MFDIEENLKQLPSLPGVYLHKDADGEVIYVGKASSLRSRVRQYFRAGGRDDKTTALASHIAGFEYIVTNTEAEALLLENTLIKRYRPRYNVMLRDDKTYPYIKITLGEEWPRLLKTRILKTDGSKYFGPYADVGAVNRIIALLNDVYRLKRCAHSRFPKKHRPCLHGHIDRCRRICAYSGAEKREAREALHAEYMADIDRIISFLKGNGAEVERYIASRMNEASERMDYEEAAQWRDYLASARAVTEKQRVELLSSGSMDIVLASPGAPGGGTTGVTVFFVRDGKLAGRERHMVDHSGATRSAAPVAGSTDEGGAPWEEHQDAASAAPTGAVAVAAFISQYYVNQSSPPKEIIVGENIPDGQFISDALSESCGYKVRIFTPVRGAKKELLNLAKNDVDEAVRREEQRAAAEAEQRARLTKQFGEIFGELQSPPRVEAYDISHTGGADSVGAMVVFADYKPSRRAYRRFKIRGDGKGDDYAAMQEVLYRRLKRAIDGDKSFLPLPDLIFVDGGKGHVSAALAVLEALRLSSASRPAGGGESTAPSTASAAGEIGGIRAAGMVKDDKHRTRALVVRKPAGAATAPGADGVDGEYDEIELKGKSELFRFTGRLQEEVHRFAIEYHKKRRTRSMIQD